MRGYICKITEGTNTGGVLTIITGRYQQTTKFFLFTGASLIRLVPNKWEFSRDTGRETVHIYHAALDRDTSFSYPLFGYTSEPRVVMTVIYHAIRLPVYVLDDDVSSVLLGIFQSTAHR